MELDRIISLFLDGKMNAQEFCSAFEEEYNFPSSGDLGERKNSSVYLKIFEACARYSPFADTEQYSGYSSEEDVLGVAQWASAQLRIE